MSQQSLEELSIKLREHRDQLKAVDDLLLRKSTDEHLLKLKEDLKQVITLTQNLYHIRERQEEAAGGSAQVRSAAAKLSLKSAKKWSVGDRCSAKWSYDGKWYSARISAIDDQTGMCDVLFLDYGNADRVALVTLRSEPKVTISDLKEGTRCRAVYGNDGLFYNAVVKSIVDDDTVIVAFTDYNHDGQVSPDDIKLIVTKKRPVPESLPDQPVIPEKLKILASDTDERKLAKRKRVKAIKSAHRLKKIDSARSEKQSAWMSFQKSSAKKTRVGFLTGKRNKESMFKTPDNFDGKVGVVGSGKTMTSFKSVGKIKKVNMSESIESV